jgi:hypothetical protein
LRAKHTIKKFEHRAVVPRTLKIFPFLKLFHNKEIKNHEGGCHPSLLTQSRGYADLVKQNGVPRVLCQQQPGFLDTVCKAHNEVRD